MNDQQLKLDKGYAAEECLRFYFISMGFFVVRGCKFKYKGFDVTDVDLWLYGKGSSFSRERINVDSKNKKTPQVLERVFWAKGLQVVLGLDRCIVATTDKRPEVRQFGQEHDVQILDGTFLAQLMKGEWSELPRITEEEMFQEIFQESLGKLCGDWRGRYESSKARLLDSLTFDGCNAWLIDFAYFFEQIAQTQAQSIASWRLVYISIAHFLIALDYVLHECAFTAKDERAVFLDSGFRFGTAGKEYTNKVAQLASALVADITGQSGMGGTVRHVLEEQSRSINAQVLSEFFSKGAVQGTLFEAARELENAAFARNGKFPCSFSSPVQAVLGVFADFHQIDRKKLIF